MKYFDPKMTDEEALRVYCYLMGSQLSREEKEAVMKEYRQNRDVFLGIA